MHTPKITCIFNGCEETVVAKWDNISKHFPRAHKDGKVTQPPVPTTVTPGKTPHVDDPTTVKDAKTSARNKAATLLFALGVPAHKVDEMRGVLLQLLTYSGELPSDTTMLEENGILDEAIITDLIPGITALLRYMPGSLTVDAKGKNKYADGRSLVHVTFSSAYLPRCVLLHADVVEKGVSKNADYFKRLVTVVMTKFGLTRDQILGIAVDNTAVNPKVSPPPPHTHTHKCTSSSIFFIDLFPQFVKEMGFKLLPCASHVINLMVKAILEEYKLTDMLGWKMYFGHSEARRDEAEAAGLKPRLADVPGNRFAFALPFYREIGTVRVFKLYSEFARSHKPSGEAGKEDESKNYALLLKNMNLRSSDGMFALAQIIVLNDLLKDFEPLLIMSQASLRHLSFKFWDSFEDSMKVLEAYHQDCITMITNLFKQHPDIKLTVDDMKELVKRTERAIELMDKKVADHLQADSVSASPPSPHHHHHQPPPSTHTHAPPLLLDCAGERGQVCARARDFAALPQPRAVGHHQSSALCVLQAAR